VSLHCTVVSTGHRTWSLPLFEEETAGGSPALQVNVSSSGAVSHTSRYVWQRRQVTGSLRVRIDV
jgi:hypothetical protein